MNKKHLHTRPRNIGKVICICIAILCICAGLAMYSSVRLQQKAQDTMVQYADVFISKLSDELVQNNSCMEDTILTSNYRNMYYRQGLFWVEQTRNLMQTYRLLNKFSINRYNFFAYNTDLDKLMEITAVTMPFEQYRIIRNEIKALASADVVNGRYELHESQTGQRIILSMWSNGEFVCGTWIPENTFFSGVDNLDDDDAAQFSLLYGNAAAAEVEDNYVIYGLTGVDANFCIRMHIESDPELGRVFLCQLIQLGLLIIGMTSLIISVASVQKNLLIPIQNLTQVLNKYKKKTKTYDAIKPEFSNTLDDAYTVLSQLGEQLETLSVRLYEAELEKRQLNINFRNLQIRPHFLVNNLATIHDMAQLNETEKIMELTVVLSNYYRYVLRDCMDMVPLWHELQHMDNILKIHQEWNGNRVQIAYRIDDSVKNVQIPVLLVSTFLENSLKHAANSEGGLNISVCGQRRTQEEKHFLYLRIRDDGNGFPQEMLDCLAHNHMLLETDGRHIGINNAIQRIRLIYGEEARLLLSNCSCGAQVEIWIPMGGEQSETSDRR